jgi:hypothetical protein
MRSKSKKVIRGVARWIEAGEPLLTGAEHPVNNTGIPWALMECGHLVRHQKHSIVTDQGKRPYRPRKMECRVCGLSMTATGSVFRTGLADCQMDRDPPVDVEVYPDNIIPFPLGGKHGSCQSNE